MTNRNELAPWTSHGLNPLADFRREMDRLFDDFWVAPASRPRFDQSQFVPACDVEEAEGHYLLSIEMPGISKDDVKVEVADSQITVSGERKYERKGKEGGARYTERQFGRFQRSFTLPAGIDAEKIEADYQDGVLHLMVPKAESAKPRQIKIGANNGSTGFFGRLTGKDKVA